QAYSSDPIPCHQPDISQLHNPIQSGIQLICGPRLPSDGGPIDSARCLTYRLNGMLNHSPLVVGKTNSHKRFRLAIGGTTPHLSSSQIIFPRQTEAPFFGRRGELSGDGVNT
ncbi:unnamed protein product, partial [Ectocarpus sp. 8 AP-2014]